VDYTPEIIRSRRRTLSVEISRDLRVIVRAPLRLPQREIARFLAERSDWIEEHLAQARRRLARAADMPKLTDAEQQELRRRAKETIPGRAEHFARLLGVSFGRVSFRFQRTRWGSCSAKGDLSFNCLLLLCPPEVLDYVVVHELCHRRHMDHSKRFWAEVAVMLPDYQARRAWLREHGPALMARLPEK
jgi:predicted metal-dependent hydrolase